MMKTKEKPQTNTKKKSRRALKIIGAITAVFVLFVAVTALISVLGNKANIEKISAFPKVETEKQLVPELDENGNWSFTTDEEFKVMQLTDVHIGGGWMSLKKDAMALNAVAAMVAAEKPDLIVVTGDAAYPVPFQAGTFNNLASAKVFAALMEQLGVYWTISFGNHDTEAYSYYGREAVSEFYSGEDMKYCLFQTGPDDVDGYGNQVINIRNTDGIITQSLFMFDSHSYVDGDILGIMWKYDNIHENQVQWYKDTLTALNAENNALLKEMGKEENSHIKSSAFFHIPLTEQRDAWYEYMNAGYQDTENVKLYYGVAGESGDIVFCGIHEDNLFETMLEMDSTKAIFCGHDHENNFSVDYKGIRFTYGMSVDYLAYPGIYKRGSQRGCTMITYSPDGSFDCTQENYYQEKYVSVYEKETVVMQELTNAPVAE